MTELLPYQLAAAAITISLAAAHNGFAAWSARGLSLANVSASVVNATLFALVGAGDEGPNADEAPVVFLTALITLSLCGAGALPALPAHSALLLLVPAAYVAVAAGAYTHTAWHLTFITAVMSFPAPRTLTRSTHLAPLPRSPFP